MLSAITIQNFKSYVSAKLPLSPLTVLIGANASGKSNAIEAMRLLAWMAQGQKLSAIQYAVQNGDRFVRGNIKDLGYCGSSLFELGCENKSETYNSYKIQIERRIDGLHIVEEELTSNHTTVPLYRLEHPSIGQGTDVSVSYDNFARGGKKPKIVCNDQLAILTQLTSPATFNSEHKQSRRLIPRYTKHYESLLSSMLFLDPVPAKMRDYTFPSDRILQSDGSNLSGVLFDLWNSEMDLEDLLESENNIPVDLKPIQRDIISFIQSLPEQDISKLSFIREPRGGVMVQLTETFGDGERNYDASLLSDGTLRVLAISAAMLSAIEGSIVVIEEIDNGVHPSRAKHLLEKIQQIAEKRNIRVLLSTHNPALLDALPDSAIPDVVFCYRSKENGSSQLIKLENISDYPELIAQGTLGHLVTSGLLERFVKNHKSGLEKRNNALKWLSEISNRV
ncbi:AAA family ATPase [Asticcacaulis excentricus]|uniref:DNA recombination and repair protein RecF n=1 Tax=Asticcacaulis excentricus TaxID=78587 RepID=A0A3G9G1X9_9CAUL|nr:ATP-binding protein [Asticcacaulis excentricus]BBF80707.1 DNA recombination and repair protein RecF [Asticcacaulis excentricus]